MPVCWIPDVPTLSRRYKWRGEEGEGGSTRGQAGSSAYEHQPLAVELTVGLAGETLPRESGQMRAGLYSAVSVRSGPCRLNLGKEFLARKISSHPSAPSPTNTTSSEESRPSIGCYYAVTLTFGDSVSRCPHHLSTGDPVGSGRQPPRVPACSRTITYCRRRTSVSVVGGWRRFAPRRSCSTVWTCCRRSLCCRSRRACTSSFARKYRVRACQISGWSRATTTRARSILAGGAFSDPLSSDICPHFRANGFQVIRSEDSLLHPNWFRS